MIERCAEIGSWVLVSTLWFPSFIEKIVKLLNEMKLENRILNSFWIFIDLQGYTRDEIPDSFLFENCIKFSLTEENNEDMEGFNDVWANILNDDILKL